MSRGEQQKATGQPGPVALDRALAGGRCAPVCSLRVTQTKQSARLAGRGAGYEKATDAALPMAQSAPKLARRRAEIVAMGVAEK